MWSPNVSLEKWLSVFPALKGDVPATCLLCGQELLTAKPYVSGKWVGISANGCECGAEATVIALPRSEKDRVWLRTLLIDEDDHFADLRKLEAKFMNDLFPDEED